MAKEEKRAEERDPGEHDQNVAIIKGLTDAPQPVVEGDVAVQVPEENKTVATGQEPPSGKCPTCGRDKVNS